MEVRHPHTHSGIFSFVAIRTIRDRKPGNNTFIILHRPEESLNATDEKREHFHTLVTQFQDNHVLITGLEDFKTKGLDASPYVVITFYPELMHKGIVLVRTDLISVNLHKPDAGRVTDQLIQSYCDDKLFAFVENFNKRPQKFDFEAFRKLSFSHFTA